MRILLVSPYFPPQNAVASLRTHGFARTWADAGHDVTVLTTAKRADQRGLELPCHGLRIAEIDYRVPRVLERLRAANRADSTDGQSTPSALPKRRSSLARLRDRTGIFSTVRMPDLTDWWFKPAAAWALDESRRDGFLPWDAVVSSSGPYNAHRAAELIRGRRLALSWIADFRDLWTDNHLHRGLFPFTLRERSIERRVLAAADLVTTVSEGLARTLRRHTQVPVEIIFNGYDAAGPASPPPSSSERPFPADGAFRIVYAGTLYPRGQDAAPLLDALKLLRSQAARPVRLVTAGQGAEAWRALAAERGVSDLVEIHEILPRQAALGLQRGADALLLLDWNDPSHGVLTTKVFEYAALEAPIVLVGRHAESELSLLLRRAGRGGEAFSDPAVLARHLARLASGEITSPRRDQAFIASLTRTNQSLRLLERMGRMTIEG